MGDISLFQKSNLPAHIAERSKSSKLGVVKLTSTTKFNRLSFDKNKFTYKQAGAEPKRSSLEHFDCVVIHAADTEHRIYWDKPYNAQDPSPPVCFSGNGKNPHKDADQKQHPKSCQLCPQNEKFSSPDGKSKACKYTYPIVLLPIDKSGNIVMVPFVANINSTSLFGDSDEKGNRFNLIQFNTHLAEQKVPSSLIVTRMSFDLEADTNSKVLFSFERFLEEEEIDSIETAVADKEVFPLDKMVSVTQTIGDDLEEANEDEEEAEATTEADEEEAESEAEEGVEEAVVEKPKPKPKAKPKAKPAKKAEKTVEAVEPVADTDLADVGLDFDI